MPYTFKVTHYIVHVQSCSFPHGSCEFPSGMLKHHKNSEISSTVSYLCIYLFISQDNAYWWWTQQCTSGHRQEVRYNVGEYVSRGVTLETHPMAWFIR